MFDTHKTKIIGISRGDDSDNTLSRCDTIAERDEQMDRRTDRIPTVYQYCTPALLC